VQVPLSLRVVEHQIQVFKRFWRGTVFQYVLNPVLYLSAIGFGLGGIITQHGGKIDGLTYAEWVAPGLMAASAMQGAASDSLWPIMAGTKWIRVFHAMVATPLRSRDVYEGHLMWTFLRCAAGAAIFLFVALLLGLVLSPWGVLAIPFAALTAAAFAAPLMAFAATQETDLRFPVIMRLGVLPLFLLSGTFFPISQLPTWLQPLAWFSPLWHGVQLCRGATTGTLGLGSALVHLAVLGGCVAGGWLWGIRSFARKLTL
jgi:lipooligosaccharide transport system permease protein